LREKNESILRLNNILNENLEKQSAEQVTEMRALRDQVDKRDKDIAAKNKELQDVTLLLSKRDKEIATLKKEVETTQTHADQEVQKMRDYVRTLEMENRNKKENSDMVVERLKEFTSQTLKLQGQDLMSWEKTLVRTLNSSATE
jgi:predicted  nucleic acid-binding Zn-ribbon protein